MPSIIRCTIILCATKKYCYYNGKMPQMARYTLTSALLKTEVCTSPCQWKSKYAIYVCCESVSSSPWAEDIVFPSPLLLHSMTEAQKIKLNTSPLTCRSLYPTPPVASCFKKPMEAFSPCRTNQTSLQVHRGPTEPPAQPLGVSLFEPRPSLHSLSAQLNPKEGLSSRQPR